jgi:hypothetical protein
MLKTFSSNFPPERKLEDKKSTYLRVKKAREAVSEIIEKNAVKDDELMVISHGGTLSHFTGTDYDENYMPRKFKMFGTAEIMKWDVQI